MLTKILGRVLPKDHEFRCLHLESPSCETQPIVTPEPGSNQEGSTIKTKHLFVLTHLQKVFFGLEVYVYVTQFEQNSGKPTERLIFISKADTNGYCDTKVDIKLVTRELIKYLLSIDPNYYLKKIIPKERNYKNAKIEKVITRQSTNKEALKILAERVANGNSGPVNTNNYYKTLQLEKNEILLDKLCLFTRPAEQYLFPDSSKNSRKHVLDGDGLLRWWASLVDQILIERFNEATTTAKLRIPGEDKYRVKRYTNQLKFPNWSNGDIFNDDEGSLAVFTVPMFPDDPKSRFIRDIVEENLTQKKTLRTFWTELQERQEFKLSVTVSVMGVTGTPTNRPIYIPNKDVFKTKSRKQFKFLKNYITGEDYETEEGALDAYTNIADSLTRLGSSLIKVTGVTEYKPRPQGPKPMQINTLQVRRKK
ncbi:Uncharacterized protein RNJ44_02936 [Nakaseomyces bracarensis]|uniref:histone acetyltransferase n=1 Tax=Nakaseomyces bracarensis TaxID=273131 RepID=A0ABR4P0N4_9SACH